MKINDNRYYKEEIADMTFDLISESTYIEKISANKATIELMKKFRAADDYDYEIEEDEELDDGVVGFEGTVTFTFDGRRVGSYDFDECAYFNEDTGEIEW